MDLLTPWSRVLPEKLTGSQLLKKFPAFYGTRRFITAFTKARHLSLSWARSIQYIPQHPTSWRSILILFSHLRLGLTSGLFPWGLRTETPMHLFCLPFVPHCDVWMHLSNRTVERVQSGCSNVQCRFVHMSLLRDISWPKTFAVFNLQFVLGVYSNCWCRKLIPVHTAQCNTNLNEIHKYI